MTDRWARVAKWGHNLILFSFFFTLKGCKRILFCSYFKGLYENSEILHYADIQVTVLFFFSFLFFFPGSVYTVAL